MTFAEYNPGYNDLWEEGQAFLTDSIYWIFNCPVCNSRLKKYLSSFTSRVECPNCSYKKVAKYIMPPKPRKKAVHLTGRQIEKIQASSLTYEQLAKKFNVSKATIVKYKKKAKEGKIYA
jgi:DNA-binding CsgD family transcriptional regulator